MEWRYYQHCATVPNPQHQSAFLGNSLTASLFFPLYLTAPPDVRTALAKEGRSNPLSHIAVVSGTSSFDNNGSGGQPCVGRGGGPVTIGRAGSGYTTRGTASGETRGAMSFGGGASQVCDIVAKWRERKRYPPAATDDGGLSQRAGPLPNISGLISFQLCGFCSG
ncbi:unnamed protein product [Trichogramma brassicae]|uniref:Uncharacterized protein n=1 Tax=Trichogramma brassicae TaxID=86971 RepID=A0A6H5I1J3_9HYME|nr:unnamed protein product [Trichogramma brassicae]